MLSYAEITLGAALLTPFLPSRLAGIGLGIFSGSLLAMYLRTPGMTLEDGIRPSPQGTALAKAIWMLGIAAALVLHRKPRPPIEVSCLVPHGLEHDLLRTPRGRDEDLGEVHVHGIAAAAVVLPGAA